MEENHIEYKHLKSFKLLKRYQIYNSKISTFEYKLNLNNIQKKVRIYFPIFIGDSLTFPFNLRTKIFENIKNKDKINNNFTQIFGNLEFIKNRHFTNQEFRNLANFNFEIQKEIYCYYNNFNNSLLSVEDLIDTNNKNPYFEYLTGTTYLFAFSKQDNIDFKYINNFLTFQNKIYNNDIENLNKKYLHNFIYSDKYLYLSKHKPKSRYYIDSQIKIDDSTYKLLEKIALRANTDIESIIEIFDIKKLLKYFDIDNEGNIFENKNLLSSSFEDSVFNDFNKDFNNFENEIHDTKLENENKFEFLNNDEEDLREKKDKIDEGKLLNILKNLNLKSFFGSAFAKNNSIFNIYFSLKECNIGEDLLQNSDILICSSKLLSYSCLNNYKFKLNLNDFLNYEKKNKYFDNIIIEKNIKSVKILPKINLIRYFINKNDYTFLLNLQNIYNSINEYTEGYFFEEFLTYKNLISPTIDLNDFYYKKILLNKNVFINKAMNLKAVDDNFNIESWESFGDSVIKLLVINFLFSNFYKYKLYELERTKCHWVKNSYFCKLLLGTDFLGFLKSQIYQKCGDKSFYHHLYKNKKIKFEKELPKYYYYKTIYSHKNISDFFESLVGCLTIINNNLKTINKFLFEDIGIIPLGNFNNKFPKLDFNFTKIIDIKGLKEFFFKHLKYFNNSDLSILEIFNTNNTNYINYNLDFKLENIKIILNDTNIDNDILKNSFTSNFNIEKKNQDFEKFEFLGDALLEFLNQLLTVNICIFLNYDLNQKELHNLKTFMNSRYTQTKIFILSGIYLSCYELDNNNPTIQNIKEYLNKEKPWIKNYIEGDSKKHLSDYFESFAAALFIGGDFKLFYNIFSKYYIPLLVYCIINIEKLDLQEDETIKY